MNNTNRIEMYEGGTCCRDTLSVIDAICDAPLAFTYPDDRASWTNHEVEYYSESLDGAKKEFHGGFLQIDLDAMVCIMCCVLCIESNCGLGSSFSDVAYHENCMQH
jgi:hypothetical protein